MKDSLEYFWEKWRGPARQSLLGVDFGTSALKLAELTFVGDAAVLERLQVEACPDDGESEVARAAFLHSAIAGAGMRARRAVLSIGARQVFTREVFFPKMTEDEVAEAVRWEIEKYIPYEKDLYYYDFTILRGGSDEKRLRVLLAAAQRNQIDRWVKIFAAASVQLVAIESETFALERLVGTAGDFIVIDIGKSGSRALLYPGGAPLATRNLPLGGDHFTALLCDALRLEAEEAELLKKRRQLFLQAGQESGQAEVKASLACFAAQLAQELKKTIDYYKVQNQAIVFQRIFLCGGGALLPDLAEALTQHLEAPTALLNPLQCVQCAEDLDAAYVGALLPQVTIAMGAALRGRAT